MQKRQEEFAESYFNHDAYGKWQMRGALRLGTSSYHLDLLLKCEPPARRPHIKIKNFDAIRASHRGSMQAAKWRFSPYCTSERELCRFNNGSIFTCIKAL